LISVTKTPHRPLGKAFASRFLGITPLGVPYEDRVSVATKVKMVGFMADGMGNLPGGPVVGQQAECPVATVSDTCDEVQ
jgi:hypothetical protein